MKTPLAAAAHYAHIGEGWVRVRMCVTSSHGHWKYAWAIGETHLPAATFVVTVRTREDEAALLAGKRPL